MNFLTNVVAVGIVATTPDVKTSKNGVSFAIVRLMASDGGQLEITFFGENIERVQAVNAGDLVCVNGYVKVRRTETNQGGVFYNPQINGTRIERVADGLPAVSTAAPGAAVPAPVEEDEDLPF